MRVLNILDGGCPRRCPGQLSPPLSCGGPKPRRRRRMYTPPMETSFLPPTPRKVINAVWTFMMVLALVVAIGYGIFG
jgi:hypothetical protein